MTEDQTNFDIGPFDDAAALQEALRTLSPAWMESATVEELFRYDGFRNAIVPQADGSILLVTTIDDGSANADGEHETVEHRLTFPDVDTASATIHEGGLLTRASYEQATRIVETRHRYLVSEGRSHAHRYISRTRALGELDQDTLPYEALRPGSGDLLFGPYHDPYERLPEDDYAIYASPVPQDEILFTHDVPVVWIGRIPERPGVHLMLLVESRGERSVHHRLSFKDADDLKGTLYAGIAPTMETYRLASSITRETYDFREHGDQGTLLVQPMTIDGLGAEAPRIDGPDRLIPERNAP